MRTFPTVDLDVNKSELIEYEKDDVFLPAFSGEGTQTHLHNQLEML